MEILVITIFAISLGFVIYAMRKNIGKKAGTSL